MHTTEILKKVLLHQDIKMILGNNEFKKKRPWK